MSGWNKTTPIQKKIFKCLRCNTSNNYKKKPIIKIFDYPKEASTFAKNINLSKFPVELKDLVSVLKEHNLNYYYNECEKIKRVAKLQKQNKIEQLQSNLTQYQIISYEDLINIIIDEGIGSEEEGEKLISKLQTIGDLIEIKRNTYKII